MSSPEKVAAVCVLVEDWWARVKERKDRYTLKDLMQAARLSGSSTAIVGQALESIGWRRIKQGTDGHRYWLPPAKSASADELVASVRALLKPPGNSVNEIAQKIGIPAREVEAVLALLKSQGYNVHKFGNMYEISKQPAPAQRSDRHIITTDANGYFKLGFTTDNHLCSKYAREDVLRSLYDWFADEGCTTVLNAGNWIDGEARFNRHDIFVHGMENQVDYFVEHYPSRKGIVTKFVSGDDHEGWYGQREGIDIGAFTETKARDAGRLDLMHLGFVEAFMRIQHGGVAKAFNELLLVHPGGGSAYATSYAPQKYVEALQGGEKPGLVLFGHWHKIFDLLIRNVVCLGGGCTKDLDPFGRKLKLAYHIGGMIIEGWLDEKGAVSRYRTEKRQFFDRGYYNHQWAYAGRPTRRAI